MKKENQIILGLKAGGALVFLFVVVVLHVLWAVVTYPFRFKEFTEELKGFRDY